MRVLLTAAGMAFTAVSFGQDALLRQAARLYDNYSYREAIDVYEQAFRKDANSIAHARRLADCYWTLREAENAQRWYAVVASSSEATPEDMYRYAELLRANRQYGDADTWLKRFGRIVPDDSRVQRKENAMERLGQIMERDGLAYKVQPVNLNSEGYSNISPFIKDGTLYFASNRPEQYTAKHIHSLTGTPFLDLYQGQVSESGIVTGIKPMEGGINTEYHESNAIISPDGRELFFTRNNLVAGKRVLSDQGVNNLQIMVRERTADGWGREHPFIHNSPSYSVGHPAMTPNGRRLYFASDMEGGYGGKDIWYCERDGLGVSWGEPINAGPEVNTEGDELFPFVYQNTLYFASDGLLGLGGLDIFQSTILPGGHGIAQNVGAPVNSPADDFGLCLDENGVLGMFGSDRDGAIGAEKIYSFHMHSKMQEQRKWAGRVLDVADGKPVPHLTVNLLGADGNPVATTVTSEFGSYEFQAPGNAVSVSASIPGGASMELPYEELSISPYGDTELPDIYLNSVMDLPVNAIIRDAFTDEWLEGVNVSVYEHGTGTLLFTGTTDASGVTTGRIPFQRFGDDVSYEVKFSRPGYLTHTVDVDFRVLMFLEHALTGTMGAAMSPVSAGVDMAKAMNLRPIYFDFRKWDIRPDAAPILDQVVEMMAENPSINIDLRSHTDSRASMDYNDLLSERRAKSSRDYLVQHGIAGSRITYKGYGERRLVNRCADGVDCTEAEHQMNRRTEFIITGCEGCLSSASPY